MIERTIDLFMMFGFLIEKTAIIYILNPYASITLFGFTDQFQHRKDTSFKHDKTKRIDQLCESIAVNCEYLSLIQGWYRFSES